MKKKLVYRTKQTESGLLATGDRERAGSDGARYVDPKRFIATPELVEPEPPKPVEEAPKKKRRRKKKTESTKEEES